jgi:TonB family protein
MKKFLVPLFIVLSAVSVAAQDAGFASRPATAVRENNSIAAARELYASARYDEALTLLNGLRPADGDRGERKTIEQYRSLCLLALGRDDEAEGAIAAVVTSDPFFVPSESDASPRVRSAFSDVRLKLLPGIATAKYAEAKQAFDRKAYDIAVKQFRELIVLLDDPQMQGRQADLRTLASGFLDLAVAAAAPKPEPTPEPPPAPKPEPPAPVVPKIYTADDAGVVAPVALRQTFPSVPASIAGMTKEKGIVEVTIDEQGRVISFSLRSSIHPVYDSMLAATAKEWKYKPATLNGKPVSFKKLIQVVLPRR